MYVQHLVEIFREVHRVLRADGTLWLNLGDSYNGSGGAGGDYNKGGIKEGQPRYKGHKIATLKNKDMIGAPWRTALALQADGWWLRSDIIWNKPNTMPESVTDRPSKTHEYVFLLTKSQKYYYDQDAIREPHTEESLSRVERGRGADHKWVDGPGDQTLNSAENLEHACHPLGRNKRTVWTVSPQPYAEAHFATWPEKLVQPMILAGAPRGGTVLDPFSGSGTTGQVALREGRNYIGIDVQPNYLPLAKARILGTPVVSEENPVDEDAYPVLDMFREW
jgi:DNA modification methylase